MYNAQNGSRLRQTRTGWAVLLISLLAATCWQAGSVAAAEFVLNGHAARPGSTVKVPVFVPDATGVASVALQLNFDPEILSLSSVTNGPLGSGFIVDFRLEDGRVDLAAVRDTALAAGAGELVWLTFQVNAGALPGMISPLVLANTRLSGEHGRDFAWSQVVSPANGEVRIVSEIFDSNQNGLPDWWEEAYFGGPTGANALADKDGDGMTNLQEFLAGTDPLDPSSVLRIAVVGRDGQGWRLGFLSVAGKSYRLERSDELLSWRGVGELLAGTGQQIEVVDDTATNVSSRFYRVMVMQ